MWDPTHVRESSGYEWLHLLGQHFDTAEFFSREGADFTFRPVPLEVYTGSVIDLAFVRLRNVKGTVRHPNTLDAFKHVHCLQLCQVIKEHERAFVQPPEPPAGAPAGSNFGPRWVGRTAKKWIERALGRDIHLRREVRQP